MYGRVFQQVYEGSLRLDKEVTPLMWAVWMYALTMVDKDGDVELWVPKLADIFHVESDEIEAAISKLLEDDDRSRTTHETYGKKRMITLADKLKHANPGCTPQNDYTYHLVNYEKYRDMARAVDKKIYNRERLAAIRNRPK